MQRSDERRNITLLESIPVTIPENVTKSSCPVMIKRIAVISPYPAALHTLVMELTSSCYDVMVFHHEDDPFLKSVKADLFIFDRTNQTEPVHSTQRSYSEKCRTLYLFNLNQTKHSAASTVEWILWPNYAGTTLLSRVDAITEASIPASLSERSVLCYKDLELDLDRMTVSRCGERIELTKTEYELLKLLLEAEGKVISRKDFMTKVWGEEFFAGSNYVDVHVKSLRQKLSDDPRNPRYISTIRSVGYRIAD